MTVDGETLPSCYSLRRHSPSGFEWGYEGSGPAQLALAILVELTGDPEFALDWYQDFKRAFVAGLRGDRWEATAVRLWKIVAAITGLSPDQIGCNGQ